MKRTLSILCCLCLVLSMAAALTLNASAEVEVTLGQEFAYNGASTAEERLAWRTHNPSEDGLWKYMFYHLGKGVYSDMKSVKTQGAQYSWNGTEASNSGTGDFDYCLVREYGKNFHPGSGADVCKAFICPTGGTVNIRTTIYRANEWTSESKGTPTGFAIFVGAKQIFPESGSGYESITSKTPREITCTAEVLQGEQIIFRINCIDGDKASDAVYMENFVSYSAINRDGPVVTDTNTGLVASYHDIDVDVTIPTLVDTDVSGNADTASSGLSTGAIVGIVIGAVVVVGAAVAAILIVKKKKEN